MGRERSRKGVLDTQLVTWIIVIAGFLIAGGFLVKVAFKQETNVQACTLSVLGRGTAPEAVQNYVPLKCETEKICLNDGGGKCVESLAGEKIREVDLPKAVSAGDLVAAKNVIEETTAKELYSCWKQMGQGKIDLFGSYEKSTGRDLAKPTCVICSRIAVDAKVPSEVLNRVNVLEYMVKNEVPEGGLTYLQALTDKGAQSYPPVSLSAYKSMAQEDANIKLQLGKGRELAIVFMQIKSPKVTEAVGNLAKQQLLLQAGGAFFLSEMPGAGALVPRLLFSRAGLYLAAFDLFNLEQSAINAYIGQTVAAGYCGQLTTNAKDKDGDKGCSIIEALPYDAQAINNVCAVIEGVP